MVPGTRWDRSVLEMWRARFWKTFLRLPTPAEAQSQIDQLQKQLQQ